MGRTQAMNFATGSQRVACFFLEWLSNYFSHTASQEDPPYYIEPITETSDLLQVRETDIRM